MTLFRTVKVAAIAAGVLMAATLGATVKSGQPQASKSAQTLRLGRSHSPAAGCMGVRCHGNAPKSITASPRRGHGASSSRAVTA
jgi:hypothetical protein